MAGIEVVLLSSIFAIPKKQKSKKAKKQKTKSKVILA